MHKSLILSCDGQESDNARDDAREGTLRNNPAVGQMKYEVFEN